MLIPWLENRIRKAEVRNLRDMKLNVLISHVLCGGEGMRAVIVGKDEKMDIVSWNSEWSMGSEI